MTPPTISGLCIDFQQNIASFWPGSAIFRLESMKRLSFNVLTYYEHFPIVSRDPLPNIYTKGGSLNPPPLNYFGVLEIKVYYMIHGGHIDMNIDYIEY